jgi:hypothetical protein
MPNINRSQAAHIDDAEAFAKLLTAAVPRVNQYLRDSKKGNDHAKAGDREHELPMLALEPLPAPERGYRLTSPARVILALDGETRPTLLIGRSHIACASNLRRAKEAFAFESQPENTWRPEGALQPALACLPQRLTFVAVTDHRDSSWPELLAHFPAIVQFASAVLAAGGAEDTSLTAGLLAALGLPQPGGFRVRVDPAKIPDANQIRACLFPSVLAATVHERGLRVIVREPFPFAGVGDDGSSLKSSLKWDKGRGFKPDLKYDFHLGWFK